MFQYSRMGLIKLLNSGTNTSGDMKVKLLTIIKDTAEALTCSDFNVVLN